MIGDDRLIVLAGGEATRWGGHLGVPKHLAPVPTPDGRETEPLLRRTLRQFTEAGVTDVHLIVDLEDPRYDLPGVIRHGRVSAARGVPAWMRSIPLWNQHGRTIILHGDWWLSTKAFRLIVEAPREWLYACRIGGSGVTGVPYGEGAGTTFWPEHHAEYAVILQCVDDHGWNTPYDVRTGSWEIWAAMNGIQGDRLSSVLDDPRHLGRRVDIPDDGSGDFDYPRDHAAWWGAWREGRIDEREEG